MFCYSFYKLNCIFSHNSLRKSYRHILEKNVYKKKWIKTMSSWKAEILFYTMFTLLEWMQTFCAVNTLVTSSTTIHTCSVDIMALLRLKTVSTSHTAIWSIHSPKTNCQHYTRNYTWNLYEMYGYTLQHQNTHILNILNLYNGNFIERDTLLKYICCLTNGNNALFSR